MTASTRFETTQPPERHTEHGLRSGRANVPQRVLGKIDSVLLNIRHHCALFLECIIKLGDGYTRIQLQDEGTPMRRRRLEALYTFDQVADDFGYVLRFGRLVGMGFASKACSISRDKGTRSAQDLLEDSVGGMATSGLAFFEERRATEFATKIRQV